MNVTKSIFPESSCKYCKNEAEFFLTVRDPHGGIYEHFGLCKSHLEEFGFDCVKDNVLDAHKIRIEWQHSIANDPNQQE